MMEIYYSNSNKKTIIWLCTMLSLTLLAVFYLPSDISGIYFQNYVIDTVLGILCIALYGYYSITKGYDLFSPLTIFSIIFIMMFYVTPIYDIITGEILWFGVDLFEYGIKGSIIAFIAYIVFLASVNYPCKESKDPIQVESGHSENLIPLILGMYIFCLACNIYYLVAVSGNSVTYLFTLGLLGSGGGEASDTSLGAISMFSFCLPSLSLLYWEYGNGRILRGILFAVMFILQVERGFRFYILQIMLMFAAYYYIRQDRKPKLRSILLLIVVVCIPLLIMTMFRSSIRSGAGMDLSSINLVDAIEALVNDAMWDNFRIYKTYYGIIKAVPALTNYMFGQQMIVYTLIMFVPRAIWSGKPSAPGGTAIALGISSYAVSAGTAYPFIGEYYYEFGIIGVVFFSWVFGHTMTKLEQNNRYNRSGTLDLMLYCTVLGCMIQLMIRGYTPSNFWMVIFACIPYYVAKRFIYYGGEIESE